MSSKANATNAAKGRRYTVSEKQEIIDFVDKVNAERGRGGQTAASKKFKISPLTISAWIRHGGLMGSSASTGASGPVSSSPIGKKLAQLQTLHEQIGKLENELARLHSQFNAIKGSL